MRPSTLEGYRGYVERNIKPRLGNKPVGKITVEDIRQMYRELQEHGRQEEHPQYGTSWLAPPSAVSHGVLHEALDAAVQENLIARNPTDGIVLSGKKGRAQASPERRSAGAVHGGDPGGQVWHGFFYAELTTGLRRGEICGLMWQDFDEAHALSPSDGPSMRNGRRLTAGETKTGAGKRIITCRQHGPASIGAQETLLYRVDLP